MPADAVIFREGPAAAPLDYELPVGTEIRPRCVTATLDGASAGSRFLAVLEVISPDGRVTSYCLKQTAIAAGGRSTVSWFPGGGVEDTSTSADDTASGISSIGSSAGTLSVNNPTGPAVNIDLPTSGVTAGTYGDSTHVPQLTADAFGRLTLVSAVAISGSAGAGGLIVLYDSGYLGADAASIDTGANGVASGHFGLMIYMYLRSSSAVTVDNVLMRFNGDSGANYDANRIQNANTTLTGGVSSAATSILLGDIAGASAPANTFGPVRADIPAYDGTSNFKAGVAQSGGIMTPASNSIQNVQNFLWRSTAAINQVTVLPGAGNLKAGSRVVIYGVQ